MRTSTAKSGRSSGIGLRHHRLEQQLHRRCDSRRPDAPWRRNTVARIRSLGADRVWELGCGTGLLLLDVAGGCSDYLGTDFSSQALETLRGEVESRGYNQVRLQACPANDFSGITSGQFDLVVLNSVVQYFPSLDYLRHVLQGDGQLALG